jgi:hypothetical protein
LARERSRSGAELGITVPSSLRRGGILDTELNSFGAGVFLWHGVLLYSKQAEKGSRNKVCRRSGASGVGSLMIVPGPFDRGDRDSQLRTGSGVLAFEDFE